MVRQQWKRLMEIMMSKLYIYGAGGHAKVVAEIAELSIFPEIIFVSDNKETSAVWSYPVVSVAEQEFSCIIAIGDNKIRKRISEDHNSNYIKLFHPSANISPRVLIGEGTVVVSGVSINSDVKIGKHCIINTNSSIDHDCNIHDFVHISPNVSLAGNVLVQEGTHIGIGATVIQGVKIGRWCVIGAGSVVLRDVPDGSTVVGNPARVIKSIII